jgi:hypothetical protein
MKYKKPTGFEEFETKAAETPVIQIVSDGTSEGTVLLVNGVQVEFTGIDFYCNSGGDYKSCSMCVRTRENGPDGLVVERSFNLRQSPPPTEVEDD